MLAMSKSRSKRLQPVARIAKDKEKKESLSVAAARSELEVHENKLKELLTYKEEYLIDFNRRAQRGVSGAQIAQYRQFIVRLDDAVEQQQQQVIQCKAKLQQLLNQWQQARGRVKALDTVIDKAQEQERYANNKKEQNMADEMSQQAHNRNKN